MRGSDRTATHRRPQHRPRRYGLLSLVSLFFLLIFSSTCVGQTESGEESVAKSPTGALADLPPISSLNWDGKKLEAEYEKSVDGYQDLIEAFRTQFELRSQRTARGGNTWLNGASNENMEFNISYGRFMPQRRLMGRPNESALIFWFNQRSPVPDELTVLLADSGAFEISWSRPLDDFHFQMSQTAQGDASILILQPDGAIYLAGDDAWTLCTQRPMLFETSVAPILRQCGIDPPLTPRSPEVIREVIRRFQPVRPERWDQFMAIVKQLDDGDFSVRERATRQLAKDFEQWRDLISRSANDPSLSIECRSRLKKLLDVADRDRDHQANELVNKLDLDHDVDYLKTLLANHEIQGDRDQEVRDVIAARIEEIQGAPNADVGAQNPNASNASNDPNLARESAELLQTVCVGFLDGDSMLNQAADVIQQLAPTTIRDGRLELHRQYWHELFDGRTAEELIEQVRTVMRENHLPMSWFQPGNAYLPETVGYPQLLFESLQTVVTESVQKNPNGAVAARPATTYSMVAEHSRNRELETAPLSAKLLVHPAVLSTERTVVIQGGTVRKNPGRKAANVPDEQFYLLTIKENEAPRRQLRFFAGPDGQTSITLMKPDRGELIQIAQTGDDGPARLVVWSDGKTQQQTAKNYEILMKHLDPGQRSQLLKTMAAMGILLENPEQNQDRR